MDLKSLCLVLAGSFVSTAIVAEEVKVEAKAAGEVKSEGKDCDSKPKLSKDLDLKALEAKAAEQKALQKLGLITASKPKTAASVILPVTSMESCK